ncbi:type III pantothenate kinase [Candidatus Nitrosacidococcus tergens]|uniref:Type III pantothenate kinase n=1 Tax=Candidatus Nitrosacidococcus tergens TaxID=553981 RepID=A0A7G1QA06_9GAMM|nr:type III pantothenate kinase [Candidatus Nitrosacidococcus tergens]CAB1275671.1 Type III pantothenate kinase [Candidatus Nitrosacidococcus tergens]
MILLVDIGNSRIKWAQLRGNRPAEFDSITRGKTGIKRDISRVWKDLKDINRVVVANVGGDRIGDQLTECTQNYWQVTPEFLTARANSYGIHNAYETPEHLGIDRWLGLIAVRQRYRNFRKNGAICIVDCGTAITVDLLAADGNHLGGLIIPGITSMSQILSDHTNGIGIISESEKKGDTLLANTTDTAVTGGALYAAASFIDRVSSDAASEIKGEFKRVITGGDALRILPLLLDKYDHLPNLVLWGLAQVARNTRTKVTHESEDTSDHCEDKSAHSTETVEA